MKPASCFGAAAASPLHVPTYTCATSVPSRVPVFVIVNPTVQPAAPTGDDVNSAPSYWNVVYESPYPNGNSGPMALASYQR